MSERQPLAWEFSAKNVNTNTCPMPVPILDAQGLKTGTTRVCGEPCANPHNRNSKACRLHQMAWPGYKNKIQRDRKRGLALVTTPGGA